MIFGIIITTKKEKFALKNCAEQKYYGRENRNRKLLSTLRKRKTEKYNE